MYYLFSMKGFEGYSNLMKRLSVVRDELRICEDDPSRSIFSNFMNNLNGTEISFIPMRSSQIDSHI